MCLWNFLISCVVLCLVATYSVAVANRIKKGNKSIKPPFWNKRNNWDECWKYLNKLHNVCWFEYFGFHHGPPHTDWCVNGKKNACNWKQQSLVSRTQNGQPTTTTERKKLANKQTVNGCSAEANQIKNTFVENSFKRTATRPAETSQCRRRYRKSMPIARTKKKSLKIQASFHTADVLMLTVTYIVRVPSASQTVCCAQIYLSLAHKSHSSKIGSCVRMSMIAVSSAVIRRVNCSRRSVSGIPNIHVVCGRNTLTMPSTR